MKVYILQHYDIRYIKILGTSCKRKEYLYTSDSIFLF